MSLIHPATLQLDLNKLIDCANKWQLRFNPEEKWSHVNNNPREN